MDQPVQIQRCPNCGTEWTPEPQLSSGDNLNTQEYICPVCQFHLMQHLSPTEEPQALSTDELQARLIALMTDARASGVSPQEIVGILSDELAFEAELTAPGRRMLVQIMDLGQFEPALRPQPTSRESELLHSRSLGQ